jgi:hypothetical protein
MVLAACGIAVGNPLAWLWVGSVVAGDQAPNAGVYALVTAGLVGGTLGLGHVLGRLSHLYNHAIGADTVRARQPGEPWHSTQRADPGQRLMTAVLLLVIVPSLTGATIWFLFFAGSPLPY